MVLTDAIGWQRWDNGRLWFGMYWVRTLMLGVLAVASTIVGAPTAGLYVALIVIPYNLIVQHHHGRVGRAHRFLVADQLLAATGAVLAPKAALGATVCLLVGAVTGTLGSGGRTAQRASATAGLILIIGGVARRDVTLLAFAGPIAASCISISRVLEYLNGRSHATSARFEELLNGLNAAIWEVDVDTGRVLYLNRQTAELIDHEVTTLDDIYSVVHPDDVSAMKASVLRAISTQEPVNAEVRIHINGQTRHYEQRSSFSRRGESVRLRTVLVDVSARMEVEQELQHRALHDSLTDLPNRVLIRRRIDEITDDERTTVDNANTTHAVLILDLDSFKDVNDGLGHHHGDLLLIEVAHRLRSAVRPTDVVARLGGDEFAVLLYDCDDASAREAAARIRELVSAPYAVEGLELHPDVSIGIARYPLDATSTVDLLRLGDVAMYRAKREGIGYAMYNASFDRDGADRLHVLAELRRAIDERELEPYYQPLVDSRTGTIRGCEALVRWRHPTRGLLSPVDFLPAVVSSGMSSELAKHMLGEVITQVAMWAADGVAMPTSVNLSASDLSDRLLMKWLFDALESAKIPAGLLTIELTEAELLNRAGETIHALTTLRDMGVTTAVDDFGTGCSSLVWLRDLPVSTVKIDRSFIESMCSDDRSHTIVKSTIELAHALDLDIIGEGVETVEIADALSELGCTNLQGYLYSRPISAGAMGEALRLGLPRRRSLSVVSVP